MGSFVLDIKLLRENLNFVKGELQKRGGGISFDDWQRSDTLQRELKAKIESLQAKKNRASEAIAVQKRTATAGEGNTSIAAVLEEMKQVAQQIEEMKIDLKKAE